MQQVLRAPRHLALRIILPTIAIIALVHFLLPDRIESDPRKRIENDLAANNGGAAQREYAALIDSNFNDIANHRGYISSHLLIPKRVGKQTVRNDQEIIDQYTKYAASGDSARADVGNYGLGYFYSSQDESKTALTFFNRIRNDSLRYFHYSRGRACEKSGNAAYAEREYRREIAIGGDSADAYRALAEIFLDSGRLSELETLAVRPESRDHLSSRAHRAIWLRRAEYRSYAWNALEVSTIYLPGAFAALCILVIWFIYLRRIDLFEPEHLGMAVATVLGGMFFSLFAGPLYDFSISSWDFT